MRTYVFTTREVTVMIEAVDLVAAELMLDQRIHELAAQGIRIPGVQDFQLRDAY